MRRFTSFVVIIAAALIASPDGEHSACDPKEDGDCCARTSDCEIVVHPSLCTLLPLNRGAAEVLKSGPVPVSGACDANRLEQLRKQAKQRKVRCDDSACTADQSQNSSDVGAH